MVRGPSLLKVEIRSAEKSMLRLVKPLPRHSIGSSERRPLAGELVPRDIFEHELAARAVIFNSDLENFVHGKTVEMIALVGGDQTKAPDLIAFLLAEKARILGRYDTVAEFSVNEAVAVKFLESRSSAAPESYEGKPSITDDEDGEDE